MQDTELRAVLKAIRRIARAVDQHSRRIDREVGLTLPQLIVLACVRDLGNVTGRAISLEAELSPATVVGILDKLEAKGLIERYRSMVDRRIVHTRITALGETTLENAPPPLGRSFEQAFTEQTRSEREQTLATLNRLAQLALSDVNDSADELGDRLDGLPVPTRPHGSTIRSRQIRSERR